MRLNFCHTVRKTVQSGGLAVWPESRDSPLLCVYPAHGGAYGLTSQAVSVAMLWTLWLPAYLGVTASRLWLGQQIGWD
ncbi:hypothetical protein AA0482_0529 [Acetobacter cibinongensis NRIC 0482]|nr:hypothetical protein AA0482_0529 [Acetobacter cibinongensis NRIC 0482]